MHENGAFFGAFLIIKRRFYVFWCLTKYYIPGLAISTCRSSSGQDSSFHPLFFIVSLDRHPFIFVMYYHSMDIIVYKNPEGFFLAVEDQFGIKHPIAQFVSEEAVVLFDQVMQEGKAQTPRTQNTAS